MKLIETKELKKIYKLGNVEVNALNGVDTSVDDGEFVAVMGPSGSGKSTFLNMLGMLDVPTSGEIFLNGKDVSKMSEQASAKYRLMNIGFVFQFFNLFIELTAVENVMFPMMLSGHPFHRERASELLELIGLGDRVNHLPSELSGGQQQRVSIARALANKPRLLLADEPSANLDSRNTKEIMELFRTLNLEHHQTIIMVTHDPDLGAMADRIIRFVDGKVVSE